MGYTQKQLARLVGCSLDMIRSIETGRRDPSLKLLRKLCKKLPLPTDDVFVASRTDEICAALLSNDTAAVIAVFSSPITAAEWNWLLCAFGQVRVKPDKQPTPHFTPGELRQARETLRVAFDQVASRPTEAHDFARLNTSVAVQVLDYACAGGNQSFPAKRSRRTVRGPEFDSWLAYGASVCRQD